MEVNYKTLLLQAISAQKKTYYKVKRIRFGNKIKTGFNKM